MTTKLIKDYNISSIKLSTPRSTSSGNTIVDVLDPDLLQTPWSSVKYVSTDNNNLLISVNNDAFVEKLKQLDDYIFNYCKKLYDEFTENNYIQILKDNNYFKIGVGINCVFFEKDLESTNVYCYDQIKDRLNKDTRIRCIFKLKKINIKSSVISTQIELIQCEIKFNQ
jgi:hypothetical protein